MNSSIKLCRRDVFILEQVFHFLAGFSPCGLGGIVGAILGFVAPGLFSPSLITLLWSGLVSLWPGFTLWAWSGLLISGLIRISFFLFLAVVITAVSVSTTVIFSAVFTFTATVEAR